MAANYITVLPLAAAALSGCSTFSDEIYVVIGEGSHITGINTEISTTADDQAAVSGDRAARNRGGFACTFESVAERPSIFSTRSQKRATLRCEPLNRPDTGP